MSSEVSLITVSWSNAAGCSAGNRTIDSFRRHNPQSPVVHSHFNRGDYYSQEKAYSGFGEQSEYLLYKVDLLKEVTLKLVSTEYVVFADYNDTYCCGKIDRLINTFDADQFVVFSSERNVYPKSVLPSYQYDSFNKSHSWHLNSGLFFGKTDVVRRMLETAINTFIKEERNIVGGDQGLWTQYLNTQCQPLIKLDYANLFGLSTYDSNPNDYYAKNGRIYSKRFGTSPVFIHDNGTNYGGQKFVERFQLEEQN